MNPSSENYSVFSFSVERLSNSSSCSFFLLLNLVRTPKSLAFFKFPRGSNYLNQWYLIPQDLQYQFFTFWFWIPKSQFPSSFGLVSHTSSSFFRNRMLGARHVFRPTKHLWQHPICLISEGALSGSHHLVSPHLKDYIN